MPASKWTQPTEVVISWKWCKIAALLLQTTTTSAFVMVHAGTFATVHAHLFMLQTNFVKIYLKMICNDFLVVKVNCWAYVFNIIQSIWILRNIKDKKIAEKASKSAHRWLVYFSQVMTSYQENTAKQPTECWLLSTDRAKTNRHNDKRRNRLLKHNRVK